ncbi:MAG: hypothetical protein Q9170_003802 [Blastenia crenularia]
MDIPFRNPRLILASEEFNLDFRYQRALPMPARAASVSSLLTIFKAFELRPIVQQIQELDAAFALLMDVEKQLLQVTVPEDKEFLETRIKMDWIQSYQTIEKVLEAFLVWLAIEIDVVTDDKGNISYHKSVLKAFDKENNLLRFLLHRTITRTYFDELRRNRNICSQAKREVGCVPYGIIERISGPGSYWKWCLWIMGTFSAALVVIFREWKLSNLRNHYRVYDEAEIARSFVDCSICHDTFANDSLWKKHADAAHPGWSDPTNDQIRTKIREIFACKAWEDILAERKSAADKQGRVQKSQEPVPTLSSSGTATDPTPSNPGMGIASPEHAQKPTPSLLDKVSTLLNKKPGSESGEAESEGIIALVLELLLAVIFMALGFVGRFLFLCLQGKPRSRSTASGATTA